MADNMNDDDMIMDLDLNQEPVVDIPPPPPFGYGHVDTTHSRIEDRLRQLEAVSARARQRQRWRQARNIPELSYMTVIEPDVGLGNPNSKRDISQLAKGLEMDLDSNNTDNNNNKDGGDEDGDGSGGFFDCNICLETARDPVLTCCGHLFCWCCFYQLSYVDSNAKECPVCKGEVTDSSISPIYGNGRNQPVLKLESGVKIPPRPQARRVESIRQQRVIRGVSHIPVAEALRRIRIRIGIGSTGENHVPGSETETNPLLVHGSEAGGSGGRRQRSRQLRVVSESAASLSSISSALNDAERLVEDFETYISDRLLRTDAQILPNNINDGQPEPQNAEMSLPISELHPSSNSRRSNVSRVLSLESGTARELRRRRLS